jgi:chemosensory pili system protein ChpA (sensor histidine kinase/response regulator)
VVDDSVTVRKVTQRLLQREGYTVMLARDGLDALQVLEETVPDILLLDIEMPRMDGFELLSRMREQPRLAGIPVVMISSRTADKHREHAAGLGVQAFLGKPYDEAELLELIGRLTTS